MLIHHEHTPQLLQGMKKVFPPMDHELYYWLHLFTVVQDFSVHKNNEKSREFKYVGIV